MLPQVFVSNLTDNVQSFDLYTLLTKGAKVGPVTMSPAIENLRRQGLVAVRELDYAQPSDLAAAIAANNLVPPSPNVWTASATIQLTDLNTVIEANHATVAIVATIPLDATLNLAVGTTLQLLRVGAAAASFAIADGGTLNAPGGLFTAKSQWSTIYARKRAANTWVLSGDIG